MNTCTRITGLAMLIVALMASPALAQSPAEGHHDHDHDVAADHVDDDEAFDQMVRGIHTIPDRQLVEERFPDIADRLVDRATDQEATEFERWRATSMLGNFQKPHVQEALLELTGDELTRVRAMAYFILGAAFLEEGEESVFETVEAGLEDSESQVQKRVIRSFQYTDHGPAIELLQNIAKSHDDEELREVAEHTLNRRD